MGSCSGCCYFVLGGKKDHGFCHRFPPRSDHGAVFLGSKWWCGEFKQKNQNIENNDNSRIDQIKIKIAHIANKLNVDSMHGHERADVSDVIDELLQLLIN